MTVVTTQQISLMVVRVNTPRRWKNHTEEEQATLREMVDVTGRESQTLPADLRWHLLYELRRTNGWSQVWVPLTEGYVDASPEPASEPVFENLRPPGT